MISAEGSPHISVGAIFFKYFSLAPRVGSGLLPPVDCSSNKLEYFYYSSSHLLGDNTF